MYKTQDELIEKIQTIKNNDVGEIARKGFELSKKHTYDKRVIELIEME
jgi:hypothetical protein